MGRIDKHFVGHGRLVQAKRARGRGRRSKSSIETTGLIAADTGARQALDGRGKAKSAAGSCPPG
ncbi:hypothetical protein MPC1_4500004 [Methylocella tundrae]|nr:hypothetical protein MPC1_4500004 [Methylocella tundrae]